MGAKHVAQRESDQGGGWTTALAISGFIAVAVAQVTNMILARGNAGVIPPFTLAFARWAIVSLGLLPFVMKDLRAQWHTISLQQLSLIATAGFLGMFLCGGPVYVAGVTTSAINIALIMSLSPVVVLIVTWSMGLEKVGALRFTGIVLALAGALLVILHGGVGSLALAYGDLLVVGAMLAWSGYTLLQSRIATALSFLTRICLFAAAGAVLSLPFAVHEVAAAPNRVFTWHALGTYLFAGLVPGFFAYAGFAWLDGRFGSVRTSLVLYVAPIAGALLSFAVLGEPPHAIQYAGGALILAGLWASLQR